MNEQKSVELTFSSKVTFGESTTTIHVTEENLKSAMEQYGEWFIANLLLKKQLGKT